MFSFSTGEKETMQKKPAEWEGNSGKDRFEFSGDDCLGWLGGVAPVWVVPKELREGSFTSK